MIPRLRAAAAPKRRPLVGLALVHIAGLVLGAGPAPPEAWGAGAALSLAAGALFLRRRAGAAFVFLAVLLLGGFHSALLRPGVSARALDQLLEAPRETLRLSGRVVDDPAHRLAASGVRERLTFTLDAGRVYRTLPGWQACRGRIRVYVHGAWGDNERPVYGDRVLLDGVVTRDPPHTLHLYPEDVRRLSSGHGAALVSLAYRWRARGLARLARFRDSFPGESGVLQAMLLGYRADLPAPVRETFQVTGAMHILAISGLHVGVVLVFLLGVLRGTGLSRRLWFLVLAPVLLAYMTAAGLPRSAIRATLMALAYWAAPMVNRRPDALSAVAVAALLILIIDPLSLQDPGFIFSFTIVTGLLTLTPALVRRWEPGIPQPADWGPEGPGPGTRLLRAARRRGMELMIFSGVAWLVSLPLMARYAHVLAPVGLLANLILVPAAFAVVWSGGLALILDASFPGLAAGAFSAARYVAGLLIRALHGLASIPGGHGFVRAPPIWAIALWYAGLGLLFRGRGRARKAAVAGLAAAALVAFGAWMAPGPLRIEVAGSSQGFGPMVRLPCGRRFLFDPGPAFRSDRSIRQLRARGVNRIETLVLTRADARHMGATRDMVQAFRVRSVWIPDYPALSRVFRETIDDLETEGIEIRRLSAGQRIETGASRWDVLHPPAERLGVRADQNDLILRLAYGAGSAVFSGASDATTAERSRAVLGEPLPRDPRALVSAQTAYEGKGRADHVLEGGATVLFRNTLEQESSEAWLDAVRPAALVAPLAAGEGGFAYPPEWLQRGFRCLPVHESGRLDLWAWGSTRAWRVRGTPP